MKKCIRYVGKHMPQGVYEVNDGVANDLLKSNIDWCEANEVEELSTLSTSNKIEISEDYLEALIEQMGWRKFQRYSKETWGTTDNDKVTLIKEILVIANEE